MHRPINGSRHALCYPLRDGPRGTAGRGQPRLLPFWGPEQGGGVPPGYGGRRIRRAPRLLALHLWTDLPRLWTPRRRPVGGRPPRPGDGPQRRSGPRDRGLLLGGRGTPAAGPADPGPDRVRPAVHPQGGIRRGRRDRRRRSLCAAGGRQGPGQDDQPPDRLRRVVQPGRGPQPRRGLRPDGDGRRRAARGRAGDRRLRDPDGGADPDAGGADGRRSAGGPGAQAGRAADGLLGGGIPAVLQAAEMGWRRCPGWGRWRAWGRSRGTTRRA